MFVIDQKYLIFLCKFEPSHYKSAFKINFWFQEVVKPKMFLLAQLAQCTHFQFCPLPNVKNCFIKQFWNKKVHISILNPKLGELLSLKKVQNDIPLYVQTSGSGWSEVKWNCSKLLKFSFRLQSMLSAFLPWNEWSVFDAYMLSGDQSLNREIREIGESMNQECIIAILSKKICLTVFLLVVKLWVF